MLEKLHVCCFSAIGVFNLVSNNSQLYLKLINLLFCAQDFYVFDLALLNNLF